MLCWMKMRLAGRELGTVGYYQEPRGWRWRHNAECLRYRLRRRGRRPSYESFDIVRSRRDATDSNTPTYQSEGRTVQLVVISLLPYRRAVILHPLKKLFIVQLIPRFRGILLDYLLPGELIASRLELKGSYIHDDE